jgi:hypothetical protein
MKVQLFMILENFCYLTYFLAYGMLQALKGPKSYLLAAIAFYSALQNCPENDCHYVLLCKCLLSGIELKKPDLFLS